MKYTISKYKIQRVLDSNFEINLPEQVLYLFEYHIRRAMKVTPIFTTWNKQQYGKEEELYQLEFLIVYDGFNHNATIKRVRVNLSDIGSLYSAEKKESDEKYRLIDFISSFDNSNIRTKEQFEGDYLNVLSELQY